MRVRRGTWAGSHWQHTQSLLSAVTAGSSATLLLTVNDGLTLTGATNTEVLLNDANANLTVGNTGSAVGLTELTGIVAIDQGTLNVTNGYSLAATASLVVGNGSVGNGIVNVDTLTAGSGAVVSMAGGSLHVTSAFTNDGTVSGFGTITAGVSGAGSVVASGGTLDITQASSGSFYIAGSSTLEFDAGLGTNVSTVTFNTGSAEVLDLTNVSSASPTSFYIKGFGSGDSIEITNAASFQSSGSTVTAYNFKQQHYRDDDPECRRIGDQDGERHLFHRLLRRRLPHPHRAGRHPVEQLAEGQHVAVLRDGEIAFTPITWIGERRINLTAHPQPQTAAPVRILAGAIGENLPERDLVLSPDHCLFLDGKLIPAKALINGMTIVQLRSQPSVHYFHVEVDPHAVLLAEGLPVESYLDTGNRAYFENAGAALVLHPEFTINAGLKAWETHACAPLTVQPEAVRPDLAASGRAGAGRWASPRRSPRPRRIRTCIWWPTAARSGRWPSATAAMSSPCRPGATRCG